MTKAALPNDNQLDVRLMGVTTNTIAFAGGVSPSRMNMAGSQDTQRLVLNKPTRPRFYTTAEHELGRFTFKIEAESDFETLGTVDKFSTGAINGTHQYNPSTLILVRDLNEPGFQMDMIEVKRSCSYHNNFGFTYKINEPLLRRARTYGERIYKGDVFADSPAVTPEGYYCRGILTNISYITRSYVTEDGFEVSDEWCQRAASTGYSEIIFVLPRDHYLLNTYGTAAKPKYFPGPGDRIRADKLIMASRQFDDILGAVEMTPRGMMEVDYDFDELKFIEASCENAQVVDVDIYMNFDDPTQRQPFLMDEGVEVKTQLDYLWEEKVAYYHKIVELHEQIKRDNRGLPITYSRQFHKELVKAMKISNFRNPKPIIFQNYGVEIPSVYIKIRFKYDIIPTLGHKLAGIYGNKGVICKITKKADMPLDQHGFQSDMNGHPFAIVNRMIPAALDDQYLNAQCMLREKQVREYIANGDRAGAWEHLVEFYKVAAPVWYDEKFEPFMRNNKKRQEHHLDVINKHPMFFRLRPGDEPTCIGLTKALEEAFPYPIGPVTFRSSSGRMIKTKNNVMIGASEIIMLEKTGHDWAAVDSPKRQVHGVTAKLNHRDRHSLPWRAQPVRFFGESEVRAYFGIAGPEWIADMLHRAGSPKDQEEIFRNIVEAERPSDLRSVIDREKFPLNTSLNQQYLYNSLYCAGARFVYRKPE